MPCHACSEFMTSVPMNTPDDLRSIADRLQRQGVRHLRLTESDEPMDWVGDFISEYFACEQCGQVFYLSAETYHGAGGSLDPSTETVEQVLQRFAQIRETYPDAGRVSRGLQNEDSIPIEELNSLDLALLQLMWNLGLAEFFPRQRLLRRLVGTLFKLLCMGLFAIGMLYLLYGLLRLIGWLLNSGSR